MGLPEGTAYAAEPVDIWGMGVVLYTLLVGSEFHFRLPSLIEIFTDKYLDTPWDEPSDASPEFCAYKTGELLQYDPWTRIKGSTQCKSPYLDHRRPLSLVGSDEGTS